MTETLQNLLISRIQKTGQISLTEFVAEALHNKNSGYYATRDPLGSRRLHNSAGDFSDLWRIDRTMDFKCSSTRRNRWSPLSR